MAEQLMQRTMWQPQGSSFNVRLVLEYKYTSKCFYGMFIRHVYTATTRIRVARAQQPVVKCTKKGPKF